MPCNNDEGCRTCDGRCCALFTYTVPLEQIADRYQDPESWSAPDDRQVLELLYPLSVEKAKERKERYGVGGLFGSGIEAEEYPENGYYACRAWNEETMLCSIYDDRPNMCKGYPYGRGCQHGCDYELTAEELVETNYMTPAEWFRRPYR